MKFANLVQQVKQGNHLDVEGMEVAIGAMMDGEISDQDMGEFLLGLKSKGETAAEVSGAARAMRSKMQAIRTDRTDLVDTCGTGGDGSQTFNISTAAALVAAGAGVSIAKHGNRKVSSRSGSADVLSELGVNVGATHETVEKCLEKVGLCFCFAPLFHGSVKNVMNVRKQLGVPTIFNMLGPLCNPASASFQVLGVGKPWQRQLIAEALQMLGTEKSVVVHGTDGICEVSNAAKTEVSIVQATSIESTEWSPEDFGLANSQRKDILASDPAESARLIRLVLEGRPSPALDIVIMNAAAAIWTANSEQSLSKCSELARQSVANGNAAEKLRLLCEVSHS